MSSRANGRNGSRRNGDFALFERFCGGLTLEQGGPMVLYPEQRRMLRDYFDGVIEILILLQKKNGKTTLLAALALWHLITTSDAECVVGATSREQASILYDQAVGFVRRSAELQERVVTKRGYREIRARRDDGRIRVLAADADTADGVIPTLALVDELGRAKSAQLYGVFRDGLGPRGGQMLTISTAGDHEGSPLGLMRAAAHKLPVQRRRGKYLYASDGTGGFVLHEWALDQDDDVDDVRIVKKVNPAPWQTLDMLQTRHDSPSIRSHPWQWQRFTCGIWVGAEAWWMRAPDWDACAHDDELRPGDRIAIGFDGSRTSDATVLVGCRLEDGLLQPLGLWEHPGAGEWEVPAGEVDARMATIMETYRIVRGYFDPPLWQTEIDAWAHEYGDELVVRYHTNRSRMMSATERLRTDVQAGTVRHSGDADLRRHVLNAHVREARGGYWLQKARPGSPDKIDLAVGAVLAYEARADAIATGALDPPTSRRLVGY
jgi:phage terminase large subunit-like protein